MNGTYYRTYLDQTMLWSCEKKYIKKKKNTSVLYSKLYTDRILLCYFLKEFD